MYQLGSKRKLEERQAEGEMYSTHSCQRAKNIGGRRFMELANSCALTQRYLKYNPVL